jgi:succinyl-diaminopimelate desuccinylase
VPRSDSHRLDLRGDVAALTAALVAVESVSGNEAPLADLIEAALRDCAHLDVVRDGDAVLARTDQGRPERVVLAGHIDTVPAAGNLPGELTDERVTGLGAADMKGGVAALLQVAATVAEPVRDVTYLFYDGEEVEESRNGLRRIAATRPGWLAADFAVLAEPTNARIEAGCQGTMRVALRTRGVRAHSARAWLGDNAIHALAEPLRLLADYQARRVIIDGLEFREGLSAVGVSGGVAGNVIPDAAELLVNYRFAPDRDVAAAEAYLRELFGGVELQVRDAAGGALPGLDLPAAQAFCAVVGTEPAPKLGWTDVARFSAMGIPAVNFGPGDPALAHTEQEWAPVEQIRSVTDVLRAWLS